MDNRPIGVFDSGLGGLTVIKEMMKMLPNENVVYFGDNGRTPYGTKSKETVIKYTSQDIRFLLKHNIKMIVIACNTISACSLDEVRKNFDIPIIEVIEPGAKAAARETKNNKVGIIGTPATISSGVYEKAVKSFSKDIEVFSKACPLFVPLVEEGWWENEVSYLTAKEYLTNIIKDDIDTLVLGCTHYPLLWNTIKKLTGESVSLVSSALEATREVRLALTENNLSASGEKKGEYVYYTSDSIDKFKTLGEAILETNIEQIEKIDIEKY